MQILYDRIRKDGIVRAGNVLKVDRFLNHQMDIHLFQEIGKEFKRRFEVESFTHGTVYDIIVSKEFLGKGDKVLVIDDFLAKGKALDGLTTLIQDSGAELVGAGIVIEKGFQDGGKRIRDKGIRVESLAIVDSMNAETGEIVFRNEDK